MYRAASPAGSEGVAGRMTCRRRRAAATARRILAAVVLLAFALPSWTTSGMASAVELVDRNPFDPHRKPWKAPPPSLPALPALTPQDLQIEAIVSFGATRGIVAQLDGKLRGTLPASAAGKVHIAVGQSFGAGYVLESITASHAVVLGSGTRYTIPVIRKANRGPAPTPAAMAAEQRAAQAVTQPGPPAAAAPVAGTPTSTPGTVLATPAPAAQAEKAGAPSPPAPQPAPAQAAASQTPSQQPMSLLEAIQAAQAAARNQQGSAPPAVNPFAIPKK